MVSPSATPAGVKGVIPTDLSDSKITGYLEDAAFEASQAIQDYTSTLSETERAQLEKYYAALLVRTLRDKPVSSTSRETASVDYEGSTITVRELREKVDSRDPSGTLAYNVDSDRHVAST